MGGSTVMFKAEADIDGREITRSYLEKIDISDNYFDGVLPTYFNNYIELRQLFLQKNYFTGKIYHLFDNKKQLNIRNS